MNIKEVKVFVLLQREFTMLHQFFLYAILHSFVSAQTFREFPPLFNAAAKRQLKTEPALSTCGIPTRNAFCRSSESANSVYECRQDFCVEDCPTRTTLPSFTNVLEAVGFKDCVTRDTINIRPGSIHRESVYFAHGSGCYLTPNIVPILGSNGAFTLTFWIWQEPLNEG